MLPALLFAILLGGRAQSAENSFAPINSTTDADCVVTFNEVQYHPREDGSDLEWIELHNQLAVDQDLSNWSLAGAVEFRFPSGTTLPANGYRVVAANPSALQASAGVIGALGPWIGRLDNAGDRLVLRNLNGRLMDELRYDDDSPWPVAADGSGASLAKRHPHSPSSPPENWSASWEAGGTPGTQNFPEANTPSPAVVDTLIAKNSIGRWLIPNASTDSSAWRAPNFDDSGWPSGTNGFGFASSVGSAVPSAQRYYRFEGTGADASGNRVHGITQNGARYVAEPAPVNGSHSSVGFDGVDDHFKVDDFTQPTAYTLSAWVKFETLQACSLVVLTDSDGPLSSWSHQLRMNAAGQFEHYTYDGGERLVTGTTVAEVDRWYHVSGTAENNGSARLYVNGLEEGLPVSVGSLWSNGMRWLFGSNSGATPNFLDGWLDEVALWHQPLSVAEIAALGAGQTPSAGGGLGGNFVTDLESAMAGVNSSAWFRLPFEVSSRAAYDQLTLTIRYADGFVAWLNGVEVVRRNSPDSLHWDSQATTARTDREATQPEEINLNAFLGHLRPGTNLFAIQGLNFQADHPGFLVEATLTARRANRPTTAVPLAFSEVPGARVRPFWIEIVNHGPIPQDLGGIVAETRDGHSYPLGTGSIPAGAIHWVEIVDPNLAFGDGDLLVLALADGSQILDAVKLGPHPQGRQYIDPVGEFLRPSASTPGTENTFSLSDDVVINEIMYHAPPTFPKPETPPEVRTQTVIGWDSIWRYEASGSAPDPDWIDRSFDDSSWGRGPSILGFRSGALAQPIRTPLPSGLWTYYFRVPFEVTSWPPADCPLQLRFLVDDGAVFYLNGREIHRHRMADGEITPTTPAINVGDPTVIGPLAVDSANLVIGTNWLAVEVHQWSPSSSDLVCGAELSSCEIVKAGIPGTPFAESEEQWIELFNRADHAVNLGGWRLTGGVDFTFLPDTMLAAGEYLVVARDSTALHAEYPDIRAVGNFGGNLSRRSDHIRLLDALGNPADEVRYADDKPWAHAADGGGSSLELRDARADNAVPEAWAASDETRHSSWKAYRFRATARDPVFGPPLNGFHELRLGLLDDGELLLDNVSVLEDPDGASTELIQNRDFSAGVSRWRLLGNHSRSRVEDDPDRPGNSVLRLVATDARGYLHNQLETTLKSGASVAPVRAGVDYEISFEAKWLSGSPQFHAELYYNRVVRKFVLDQPFSAGTPGRPNSTFLENFGPTYSGLQHDPPVPKPGQPVRVRIQATDPDGVAGLTLRYIVHTGAAQATAMNPLGEGTYEAALPAQASSGTVIQFWVEGRDARNAVSFAPAEGANSRALVRFDSRVPGPRRRGFHMILTARDAARLHEFKNLMSDDRLGATVVWDNREIFYDCGVHLHGSMFSRNDPDSCSFNVRFPADHHFRGVHRTVQLKRRVIQEIVGKFTQVQSGLPGMYEDIVELLSHRTGNSGPARMSLAHYGDVFLASQFPDGDEGTSFNMEGIRVPQATDNGTVEGIKLPFPVDWVGNYDITDLGDDPEQYRWATTIKSRRARDDYSHYMAMAKAFDLRGEALVRRLPDVADVDEWMRVFALTSLFGIGDTYTQGNPHNLQFYVRPSDGRVLALPYDWDFFFAYEVTAPLWGDQNLSRIIATPVFTRIFHGHLLDLMETTFNDTYLRPWVTQFAAVAGDNYSYVLDRVRQRSQFVRGRLPAKIGFEITTNGGTDFAVDTPVAMLEGRGWIDVHSIRFESDSDPLVPTWLDAQRWRLQVPLPATTNELLFEALNRRGERVGEDGIVITTSAAPDSQRAYLRVTELMYHPADPTAEELAAGFTDADDFEFVELANLGPVAVPLAGVRFTSGITYDFTDGRAASLPAGNRVLVVKNEAAFVQRYGGLLPVIGEYSGSLNNAGELLRLVDRHGIAIQEFSYSDDSPWPVEADGSGRSLEARNGGGNSGDATNWQTSVNLGGSPGVAPVVAPPTIGIRHERDAVALILQWPVGQTGRILSTDSLTGSWVILAELEMPNSQNLKELHIPLSELGTKYFRIEVDSTQ